MTTKPKARKFRIKCPTDATEAAKEVRAPVKAAADPAAEPARKNDAIKHIEPTIKAAPAAQSGEVSSAAQVSGELDMDTIRREGLTGRQLRMARRVAQKHGLPATSDFDAVRLLRSKGIDPFQRSNMLELVVPQSGGKPEGANAYQNLPARTDGKSPGRVQLPQTVPAGGHNLPSTEQISPSERRTREISAIQRDITRRRRKKMGLLLVRLAFFVFLPALFAGYYFYKVATPMYATDSQFLILTSEGSSGPGGFGGLLPAQFATSADSIAVQSFLQSKDAMLRLDGDVGFKSHFTDERIDAIQRLTEEPTNEEAYKLYKKNVKIGYDPTEGVIRMEVIAADPQVATDFSQHLINYAEERVNNLSQQKREDQMRDAGLAYEKAQTTRDEVQERLIEMQVTSGVDPTEQIGAIRAQITTYESLLFEKELELAAILDNVRPSAAKVDGARGDVRRINDLLIKLEAKMSQATEGSDSLAQKAVEMQLAQAALVAADSNVQLSQTAMEMARTEANRQVRYLTVAVKPVASEEPSYPRKFENTVLAFLIFAGIYLMISLTASILREQVTA